MYEDYMMDAYAACVTVTVHVPVVVCPTVRHVRTRVPKVSCIKLPLLDMVVV